jgi:hypothetical protein
METLMNVTECNKTTLNGGTFQNSTSAAFILTHNAVAAMEEVDIAPFITLLQFGLVNGTAYFGGVATCDPLCDDFHVGPHIDLHVGPHFDLHSLSHTEVHVGNHLDVHLNTHTDLNGPGHTTAGAHATDDVSTVDDWHVNMTTGTIKHDGAGGKQTVTTTPTTHVNASGATTLAPAAHQ